ncbi:MAG: head GIN domain-containing protein [Sphingomonas sp.]
MKMLALALLVPLAACSFHSGDGDSAPSIPGSGSGTARNYQASDFTAVSLHGADNVDIRVGGTFSVRAEGPSAELDKLKIVKKGDTLRMGRVEQFGFLWGGNHSRNDIKIYVTMPRITATSLTGSGDMTVDRVTGQKFTASTTGSGSLTIDAVGTDEVSLSIAGSGDMKLQGATKRLGIDITGAGGVDAGGLKATSAKVSIAGSGGVKADVTGPASVSVMGSGDVDLGPGAKCSTSKMGSGEVHCGS